MPTCLTIHDYVVRSSSFARGPRVARSWLDHWDDETLDVVDTEIDS